jgi:hypothetical protein
MEYGNYMRERTGYDIRGNIVYDSIYMYDNDEENGCLYGEILMIEYDGNVI